MRSAASRSPRNRAKGVTAARRTAELLATSLNATAVVHGQDAAGEFVYGVHEVNDEPAAAASPLVKRLYAESASASLDLKDRLLADIPEETIKGVATMAAALGYFVEQHKAVKRASTPHISYAALSVRCAAAATAPSSPWPRTTPPWPCSGAT